jgi:hypothetical protein
MEAEPRMSFCGDNTVTPNKYFPRTTTSRDHAGYLDALEQSIASLRLARFQAALDKAFIENYPTQLALAPYPPWY